MRFVPEGLIKRGREAVKFYRSTEPALRWIASFVVLLWLPCIFLSTSKINLADNVRWSGMFLQLAGVLTVAWGLKEVRDLFRSHPIAYAIGKWSRQYIQQFVRVFTGRRELRHYTLKAEGGVFRISGGSARTKMSGGTLDDRVQRLEDDVDQIHDRLQETDANIRKLGGETEKSIARERKDRMAADETIDKRLETAMIGGIRLELAGVLFLVVGISFATIPDFIARYFNSILTWLLLC